MHALQNARVLESALQNCARVSLITSVVGGRYRRCKAKERQRIDGGRGKMRDLPMGLWRRLAKEGADIPEGLLSLQVHTWSEGAGAASQVKERPQAPVKPLQHTQLHRA